jgi:murein DD-endopeptidase MepM/ murein hydrolase activator NlpD
MICETGSVAALPSSIRGPHRAFPSRRRFPSHRPIGAVSLVAATLLFVAELVWMSGQEVRTAAMGGGRGGTVVRFDMQDRPDTAAVIPSHAASDGHYWTLPVRGRITSGFRTAARPDHLGVDIAASKGTAVHAVADGTVTVATCDPATVMCDRDGSLQVAGCGWYVEIVHAGGVRTRYCHLQRRPDVQPGQHVLTGQVIGAVGASGHATGPHLHFEVHVPISVARAAGNGKDNGRGEADEAVDPVRFIAQHGVTLGVG